MRIFVLVVALLTAIVHAAPRPAVEVVRSLTPPLSAGQFNDIRLTRGGEAVWLVTAGTLERWARRGAFKRDGVWNLPDNGHPLATVYLAAVDGHRIWLVDAIDRRAWLFRDGKWGTPIQLADAVTGATALPSGLLVVNTPSHSAHSLALVNERGEVTKRFGGRIASKIAQQNAMSNTWRLATLRGGRIVAAHGHLPLLRIYEPDVEQVLEKTVDIPRVRSLEDERLALESVIDVRVEECCVSSKAVHFATAVATNGDEIAVRYGLEAQLSTFDSKGRWIATTSVGVPAIKQRWITAGTAYFGREVVAAEQDRVVSYPMALAGSVLTVRIVGAGDEPVVGAKIVIASRTGMRVETHSGDTGQSEIRGLDPTLQGDLSIQADGYLTLQRSGVLSDLLREPLRMQLLPKQCVEVRSAGTSEAIQSFRLSIGKSTANQRHVSRGDGITRDFADVNGQVCLQPPFAPPFLVQVFAEHFATREVEVATAADIVMELEQEVPFKVVTRAPDGAPVSQARVSALSGNTERRREMAVDSEAVKTTDHDGHADFQGFGPGKYRLVIEHPDFLRLEREVELSSSSDKIAVTLERGAHLIVKVSDSASQQPLSDSQVQADPRGVPITRALQCVTGADGTCELIGLPVGRYAIRVEHPNFAPAHDTVVIQPGTSPVAHISLSRAATISGRVIGTEQYPDTKFQVEVAKPGVPVVYAPVSSSGDFRISEAPTGSVSFWVTEPSVDSTLVHRLVDVPAGADNFRVDLELPVPVSVSGLLSDPSGDGCGRCSIEFERVSGEYATTLHRARVQGDGRYDVRLSSTGPYLARVKDAMSGVVLVERVDVRGRSVTRDFKLARRTVEVRVKEPGGTAAAGAVVMLQSDGVSIADVTADSFGVARFSGVAAKTVRATATLSGRTVSREITIDREETTVELQFWDAAPLRLSIVDAASNLALYSVDVRVTGASGETIFRTNVIRDEEGIFTLPSFSGGPMTVVVEANGYAVRTMHGVATAEAPQRVPLTPRWRAFTVEVDTRAMTPCWLEVRDATGRVIALSARTGAVRMPFTQSSAMFAGLDWGTYSVTLYACDGKSLSKPLILQQGRNSNITFP